MTHEPGQGYLIRRAVFGDADDDLRLGFLAVMDIRPQQAVPEGQIEPVIGIGLVHFHRMMNPVHIRRHQQPTQDAVQPQRQFDIGMVKLRHTAENRFKHHYCHHRWPQRHHQPQFIDHGPQNLQWMKTKSGGHIQIQVGMMHLMEPPEKWNHVEHHMLDINHQVQKNDSHRHFHRHGPIEVIEQAPTVLSGEIGQPHCRPARQPAGPGVH